MDLQSIKLIILDVDGVLTGGTITMDAEGESVKTFHVQDGMAIKLWQQSGGEIAILSSRKHQAVLHRTAELGIMQVHTGVKDKWSGYQNILQENKLTDSEVCYVGDDLPDLKSLSQCGFGVAVCNAVPAIKRRAKYVTRRSGGIGAIAEIVEFLLRKQKKWTRILMEQA